VACGHTRDAFGRLDVDGLELLPPRRREYPHEIDYGIRPAYCRNDGSLISYIGLKKGNLPYEAERLQMQREIGAAHGDLYAAACPRQGLHHVAAQKARTAENGDDGGVLQSDGHGSSRKFRRDTDTDITRIPRVGALAKKARALASIFRSLSFLQHVSSNAIPAAEPCLGLARKPIQVAGYQFP
jgi:hypothetical protein